MSGTTHSGSGFVRELGDVCSRVLEGLAYRVDLVALELKEEKERLVGLLVAGIAASLCAFMAFLVLNVAILAVAWDHRIAVLLTMLGIYLVLALGGGVALWRKVRSAPSPFQATVDEIKKDQAAFFSER